MKKGRQAGSCLYVTWNVLAGITSLNPPTVLGDSCYGPIFQVRELRFREYFVAAAELESTSARLCLAIGLILILCDQASCGQPLPLPRLLVLGS
jgi:hypothetical protein